MVPTLHPVQFSLMFDKGFAASNCPRVLQASYNLISPVPHLTALLKYHVSAYILPTLDE